MKKIKCIFFIFSLFLLSGCSSEAIFDFNENSIESNIKATFNEKEFIKYLNSTGVGYNENYSSYEINKMLNNYITSNKIPAYFDDTKHFYNREYYRKSQDNYSLSYKYKYDYNNIKNSHYLNYCFENFIVYEDDNNYYFKISGNNKCDLSPQKLIIKSKNGVGINNADNVEDNKYIWEIKDDNNIRFSINKTLNVDKNKTIFIIRIIVFILLITGFIFILYFLKNKN